MVLDYTLLKVFLLFSLLKMDLFSAAATMMLKIVVHGIVFELKHQIRATEENSHTMLNILHNRQITSHTEHPCCAEAS